MEEARGWYSRGYLPHIDAGSVPQFVTWRLADSLPRLVLHEWEHELRFRPEDERKMELSRRISDYIDEGHGLCVLRLPEAARMVQETIFHDHQRRYQLHAWVVMPNHVHLMMTPCEGVALSTIMEAIKKFSSNRINRLCGRNGRLWQPEYFDRLVRTPESFERIAKYIEWNPVKAKLCSDPSHWTWSSANESAWKRLELLGEI